MKRYIHFGLSVLLVFAFMGKATAQGTNTGFGQNRIQYDRFNWLYISSTHFNGYYYDKGEDIAVYALKRAEAVLSEVEKDLGYRLSAKMRIVLYNSLSDYKQSNIGLQDPQFNSGGYAPIMDDKMALYFDGDYVSLQQQIKKGIATVLLNEMMYGGSIQERLQNATLLNLPVWFSEGLVSYLSNEWSVKMDDRMKDAILWDKMKRFNTLTHEEQIFAGHSIWKYLIDVEGKPVIANILYVTRLTRNFEDGLQFVLGENFNTLYTKWLDYYVKLYQEDDDNRFLPDKPEDIEGKIAQLEFTQMKINPRGNEIAFVTNERGLRTVRIHHRSKNTTETIFKLGFKGYGEINPNDYPLIAWEPDGREIAIIYADKGITTLRLKNIKTGKYKEKTLGALEQVLSFNYSASGDKIVLSAIKRGQADLYEYNLQDGQLIQLTDNIYTEATPAYANNDSTILFSSNEGQADTTNQLKLSPTTDIFAYNTLNGEVTRLTATTRVNETNPVDYTGEYYSFLADDNGIFNSYVIKKDPANNSKPLPLTNYKRSILTQNISKESNTVAELLFYENSYRIYVSEISDEIEEYSKELKLLPTAYIKSLNDSSFIKKVILEEVEPEEVKQKEKQEEALDKEDEENAVIVIRKNRADSATSADAKEPYYQNPYPDDFEKIEKKEEKNKVELLTDADHRKYKLEFAPTYFVAQLDNSIVNTYYIPIDANRGLFSSKAIAGLTKVGVADLMNNYTLELGARMTGLLSGTDYWMSFTDGKGRIDKTFSYFRKARFQDENTRFKRVTVNEGSFGLKYPFSERSSIQASVFYRQDDVITLSSDRTSLPIPDNQNSWAGIRAKYIYDNTVSTGLNLYNGFKFKLFVENYNAVEGKFSNLLNLGADFRHYLKVDRQIIWANRFSVNTSVGPSKILYFLGGVENWINPKFNNDIGTVATEDYAFQALSNNLRGFQQNIRNGNSIASLNSELRVPIVQYFSFKPVKSDFFKNVMLVPFVDIGTAWVGKSPYSIDNPFNVRYLNRANLDIKVVSQGNPFVGGYGMGIRTRILGYYFRFDKAWGIAQNKSQGSVNYFSLGMDF